MKLFAPRFQTVSDGEKFAVKDTEDNSLMFFGVDDPEIGSEPLWTTCDEDKVDDRCWFSKEQAERYIRRLNA